MALLGIKGDKLKAHKVIEILEKIGYTNGASETPRFHYPFNKK